MKTHKRVNENLFKSIETAYNIRVVSKFEAADWALNSTQTQTVTMPWVDC